eukprot:6974517-Pyramimonas_sp.AAC.1
MADEPLGSLSSYQPLNRKRKFLGPDIIKGNLMARLMLAPIVGELDVQSFRTLPTKVASSWPGLHG